MQRGRQHERGRDRRQRLLSPPKKPFGSIRPISRPDRKAIPSAAERGAAFSSGSSRLSRQGVTVNTTDTLLAGYTAYTSADEIAAGQDGGAPE
ncbi:LxmA leader domain family RiPP, partial [Streptomyces sp. NPDC058374]|uniref:LxmA leader domain family RiPP n=1 Tax=Streptomyces sp. NPDC058374 TaxID=3346466 RepID=UPI00365AFED0